MKKTIGVIGAGMVGVAAASFLQREGHDVVLVEPGNPGEGTSFGNAGCLNGSSVVPMSMPGTIRNVPRWLTDPMGPLVIRWSYLPTLAPWLIRFIAAGRPEKVREQAKALRAILGPSLATLAPLLKDAGAEDLVKKAGHLFVYRSEESFRKESLAWQLRRDNGVTWDEFDADELRQLEPTLSRDYVKGVLVAGERAHDEPAPARRQPRPKLSAQRRPDRACACDRIRARWRPPQGHPHRRRRRSGGRRGGRGRRLVEAARGGARRRPAARDRARLPPHDPRSRGGAAPAGRRRRRQVRRNPDGARHPRRRHGRARRPQGAAELGARPRAPAARAPDVSGAQGELSGRAHLDLDGPPPEPARTRCRRSAARGARRTSSTPSVTAMSAWPARR